MAILVCISIMKNVDMNLVYQHITYYQFYFFNNRQKTYLTTCLGQTLTQTLWLEKDCDFPKRGPTIYNNSNQALRSVSEKIF